MAGRTSCYFLADFSHAVCVRCWLGNGEVDVEVDDVGGLQSVEYVYTVDIGQRSGVSS